MRVGIRFGFCQETTRLEWGGRIWKIFGTRQKRGFTKGRSLVVLGIWHLVF